MKNVRHVLVLVALGVGSAGLLAASCSDSGNGTPPADAGGTEAGDGGAIVEAGKDAEAGTSPLVAGQTDRLGRPTIIQALIPLVDRDSYNRSDPLDLGGVSGLTADDLTPTLQRSLVLSDRIDGVDDWDGGSPDGSTIKVPIDGGGPDASTTQVVYTHPLVALGLADVLIVDTSKPFSPTGYLDVEKASLIAGTPGSHLTCGGRWLADDVVDKTMSFIIKKSLTGVSDGVSAATKAPALTFPYLAPPN